MADDFEGLPRTLQLQIDAAFDDASPSHIHRPPPKKRRKLTPTAGPELAGGFIIEDAAGGFISLSDEAEKDRTPSEDDVIPFSLIPTALQNLDLPPDDEEVLQVFRNAAGGWSGDTTADDVGETSGIDGEGGAVSRKDWRAVCAVVVGNVEDDVDAAGDPGGGFVIENEDTTSSAAEKSFEEAVDEEDVEDDAADAYEGKESDLSSLSSFSDPGEDSDSDEYLAGPSKSKSKYKSKSKSNRGQTRSETPGAPTQRQRKTALEAYSLFFPSSPPLSDEALTKKRLTYKDIATVADLLKEKIKADEITEMLSLFSISPDVSMGFEDFTRMMIMAKLA